jgi:hypothetical protein
MASQSAPNTTLSFCDGTLGVSSGTLCRETPDVSAQADEFTGAVTIYGKSLGYGNANGWATVGGTSSATPIWAAVLALVNASPTCSADKINGVQDAGFASPILYGVASNSTAYANSFNDIVAGDNDEFGVDNGLVYPARKDYDMASGLGSPQLTTSTGGNGLAFYMCDYDSQLKAPSVTALSPTSGSTAGGYSVTVTGSGFMSSTSADVASVQVGSATATSFSVVSNTSLTAVLPRASATVPASSVGTSDDGAGPATVIVRLTSGESSYPLAGSVFEYVDESSSSESVPSVTGVSPYGGLEASPASVTIYGSGFTGATGVTFGAVAATNVSVKSSYEITATPPAYTASATCEGLPGTGVYEGEGATNDICQVEVVVTNAYGSSATSTIWPPYEGTLSYDGMDGEIIPSGYEDMAQPTEYDYYPTPTITSVSTGTLADLKDCAATATSACNASDLASEYGFSAVTIKGTGMNALTLNYVYAGSALNENTTLIPVSVTGTSIEVMAPSDLNAYDVPSTDAQALSVGFGDIAGVSNVSSIVYAGVPEVDSVTNTLTGYDGAPDAISCPSLSSTGCGAPLKIGGSGFLQATGPMGFVDNQTGASMGTQYNYAVTSDTSLTTESVAQNPAMVDVEVCSETGCSYDPGSDYLYVYPPGNPKLDALSSVRGPAQGSNKVTITGANLGCAVEVLFGSTVALATTNKKALLVCGATNEIVVTVPPGRAGTTVAVRVATVESYLDSSGTASNALAYTYTKSAPSGPGAVIATKSSSNGATVRWTSPVTDGGSAIKSYAVTATSSNLPSVIKVVGSGARRTSFANLQANALWQFSVSAISARGTGLATESTQLRFSVGGSGYRIVTAGGSVFGFGSLWSRGGIGGQGARAAGIATTPDALGYWIVTTTGKVDTFGDAQFYGQASLRHVVGIASAAGGKGYWIATRDGVVRSLGAAKVFTVKVPRGAQVAGIASTSDRKGYWLVLKDGAVKAFGDAHNYGSPNPKSVAGGIVGIAATPNGKGYWLADADGGVFSFGDAGFYGSLAKRGVRGGVVAIAAAPSGNGYWLVFSGGRVANFGGARLLGHTDSAVGISA